MHLQDTETLDLPPPFAALSYCWGGDQPVKCLVSTLASLKTAISFDALPATTQDSVFVCEQLGYWYLWIDALCIVQDCDEEKAVEIAKMPYIYGNSMFTIIATRSASAWEGFLRDRIPSPDAIPAFSMRWVSTTPEAKEEGAIILIDLPIPSEPIDARGWTLQERALSTRAIEFGSRQTRWTCQRRASPTNSRLYGFTDGWRAEQEANLASFDPLNWSLVNKAPYHSWASFITQYSRRELAQGVDRPLAISGLAERFSRLTGERYIAGLWMSHLHGGLLWSVPSGHRKTRPARYQGPSWSWQAVQSQVDTYLTFDRENFGTEILSVSAELANHKAPFGATKKGSGKLRVRRRFAPVTYPRADSLVEAGTDVSRESNDHKIRRTDGGTQDTGTAELFLDHADDVLEEAGASDTAMALELQNVRVGSACSSNGLVLHPAFTEDGLPQTSDKNVPVYVQLGAYEFVTDVNELS